MGTKCGLCNKTFTRSELAITVCLRCKRARAHGIHRARSGAGYPKSGCRRCAASASVCRRAFFIERGEVRPIRL